MFELLSSSLFAILKSVSPFLILLGVLIFIHELGHFLVARWCGVSVEIFSLGFGPKILKYRYKETLYCISLIPLGGYVKMYGDNLVETIPDSEKHRGFLYQSVPKKLSIAFGGPLMNLLFTLVAFYFLALYGIPSFPSFVGDVSKNTHAYQEGLRSGDKILSIEGKSVKFWKEISSKLSESLKKNVSMKVKSSTGEIKDISLFVQSEKSNQIFSNKEYIGRIKGLNLFSLSSQVGITSPKSQAAYAGFESFDRIIKLDKKKVRYWREVTDFLKDKTSVFVEVERILPNGKIVNYKKEVKSLDGKWGFESLNLYLNKVGPNTPADEAGLKRGDKLLAINGNKLKDWQDLLDIVSTAKPIQISYRRQGKIYQTKLIPKEIFVEGHLNSKPMIGVASANFMIPPKSVPDKLSFIQAASFSVTQTAHWLKFIVQGLVKLIKGEVSPRTMGGPVAIGRMAYKSFETGLYQFLLMMAVISLSLFFFNLLPIPVLDGGHILFFTIEGILRKPLPLRYLLVAQSIGLFILILFFVFVFFNDVINWLNSW